MKKHNRPADSAATKNSIHRVEITDRNNLGNGIGRIDGKVIFVPRTAAGDVIDAKIIKSASDYLVGRVENVVSSSPHRIETDCEAFIRCGGCVHRDISYEYELALKRERVVSAFRKCGIDAPVEEIRSTGITDRYRNKVQMPVGRAKDGSLVAGFYAPRSHDIVAVENCLLQRREFDGIIPSLLRLIPEGEAELFRHIYLRTGGGKVAVCLVCSAMPVCAQSIANELTAQFAHISGVSVNLNPDDTNVILGREYVTVFGESGIHDTLCGVELYISPPSFYQVNRDAAQLGYGLLAEMASLSPGQRLCDIYCGIGSIGLSMLSLSPGAELTGIEIVPEAVEDAAKNAERNGIRAEFFCADAADPEDKTAASLLRRSDIVVLDPPRKGCSPELLDAVSDAGIEKICYLSCDPETLARDAAHLTRERGYRLERVVPVDFFPRTGHCETVCLLSKLDAKQHIEINLDMDELDLTDAEKKATCQEIKDYVLEHSGLKVSSLYIAQVKQQCGIIERENYNKPKSENAKQLVCPPDKEKAIKEALRHFGMI